MKPAPLKNISILSLLFILGSFSSHVFAHNENYHTHPPAQQASPGYGYNAYPPAPYYGDTQGGGFTPFDGNTRRFSNPWRNRGQEFNKPWNSNGWGNNKRNPFGSRNPGQWMNPDKNNLSNNWDDMLNAPSRMGRMPGGWEAPSISAPNPIDVGDEFNDAARDLPDQMHNFRNYNYR